eukprot:174972-Rhodomonas_salina.2
MDLKPPCSSSHPSVSFLSCITAPNPPCLTSQYPALHTRTAQCTPVLRMARTPVPDSARTSTGQRVGSAVAEPYAMPVPDCAEHARRPPAPQYRTCSSAGLGRG